VFIREKSGGDRGIFSAAGNGCHAWRGIALSRALTEAAQCRLTPIAGAREDLAHDDYAATPERLAQVRAYVSLAERPSRPFRAEAVGEPDLNESFADSLSATLSALQAAGIAQAVAVSLAPEELGPSVVRMLVPGPEGLVFDAGYVPGARARYIVVGKGA
jgi:ribosomal protein S12 methylthiotransferase accessory factor